MNCNRFLSLILELTLSWQCSQVRRVKDKQDDLIVIFNVSINIFKNGCCHLMMYLSASVRLVLPKQGYIIWNVLLNSKVWIITFLQVLQEVAVSSHAAQDIAGTMSY